MYNNSNDYYYQLGGESIGISKHSVQRDAIINELCSRHDHPTADEIYISLKDTMPTLSLGTVYRNLSWFHQEGSILKIPTDGADRFDGNTDEHYHLICRECGHVFDLDMPVIDNINSLAEECSAGKIFSHALTFYGICHNCINKNV